MGPPARSARALHAAAAKGASSAWQEPGMITSCDGAKRGRCLPSIPLAPTLSGSPRPWSGPFFSPLPLTSRVPGRTRRGPTPAAPGRASHAINHNRLRQFRANVKLHAVVSIRSPRVGSDLLTPPIPPGGRGRSNSRSACARSPELKGGCPTPSPREPDHARRRRACDGAPRLCASRRGRAPAGRSQRPAAARRGAMHSVTRT